MTATTSRERAEISLADGSLPGPRGTAMCLVAPSLAVRTALRATGLAHSSTIYPDLPGALAVERRVPATGSGSRGLASAAASSGRRIAA